MSRERDGGACNLFPVINIWTSLYPSIALLFGYAWDEFRHRKWEEEEVTDTPIMGYSFSAPKPISKILGCACNIRSQLGVCRIYIAKQFENVILHPFRLRTEIGSPTKRTHSYIFLKAPSNSSHSQLSNEPSNVHNGP